MEEAYQLCDRLIIMDAGQKVLEGRPETLMLEHMEPYVLEIVTHERNREIALPGKHANGNDLQPDPAVFR